MIADITSLLFYLTCRLPCGRLTMAQPNFQQLQEHLEGVAEQVALVPNLPAIAGLDALINALAQQAEHNTQVINRLDILQQG